MSDQYYKTIDGKKYDAGLLKSADECVEGRGDGRVSKADAEALVEAAMDGNKITAIEHDTLDYIKENYKFTSGAKEHLDELLKKVAG